MVVEANQLPEANTMVSLAILKSSGAVTQMHKMPGFKVRVMVTKAVLSKPCLWLWLGSWAGLLSGL